MREGINENMCPGCFLETFNGLSCSSCGYAGRPSSHTVLQHKTLLKDRYLVGNVLGRPGGFGITYLCYDIELEMRIAIKEYLPRDLAIRDRDGVSVIPHTHDDQNVYLFGLEKFRTEARVLAKFNHPNIVRVHNFFEANDTGYLVMDYYEGIDLGSYISKEGGRIDEDRARKIMLYILDGLKDVHSRDILHRDIDPSNIYITNSGRVILLDFGAARVAVGERSKSLDAVLKPGYAPYEQYSTSGNQGPWTDIYACGATLYKCVTGEVPLASIERLVTDSLKPPKELNPEISEDLNRIILHALNIRPEERPGSVAAMQDLLLGKMQTAPSTPPPTWEHEPQEEEIACHNCGTKHDASFKFCRSCGTRLERRASSAAPLPAWNIEANEGPIQCTNCGTRHDATYKFCRACGTRLPVELTGPAGKPKDHRGLRSSDKTWVFLGNFCISPLLGVILYFIWKDDKPQKASQVCSITWWSIGIWVILVLLVMMVALAG